MYRNIYIYICCQVNALIADWARAVVADDADFPVPRKPRYRNAPIADASLWNM